MKNGAAYKKNRVAQKCTYLFSIDLKMCCSLVIIAKKSILLQKKSNAYNIRLFSLKPLHRKKIFLSEKFVLKMASVKLATGTSSIKAFHVYRRSSNIG